MCYAYIIPKSSLFVISMTCNIPSVNHIALFSQEKEIQNLLDLSKSDEMRRTLADGKSDSSAVIHSLKQKILKLEQGLREKESQYAYVWSSTIKILSENQCLFFPVL